MLGKSGTDVDKKISSLSDDLLDLKNQKKLAELDFEKRFVILEDAVNTITRTVGSAKNLKDMKKNLDEIIQFQGKIHEFEDREIIDRLETMQTQDSLNLLEDKVDTISKKLELISGAVKILGEKTKESAGAPNQAIAQKISTSTKDADALRAEIEAVRIEKADINSVKALESKLGALEKSAADIDKKFAELASSVRGSLNKRDNDFSVIEAKMAELEELPQSTAIISSRIDALTDADKKLEGLVASLRNQVSLAEEKIKAFDSVKKGFDESLKSREKEYADALGAAKNLGKKFDVLGSGVKNALEAREYDLAGIRKKIAGLETMELDAALLSSKIDALKDAGKKTENLVASLRNQVSLAEEKIKPLEAGQQIGKNAFLEAKNARKDLEAAKKSFGESLKSREKEYMDAVGALKRFVESGRDEIQKSHSFVMEEHARMKEEIEELNWSLEKRVAKSANEVLERQTRLQKESLEALRGATSRVERRGAEIELLMQKRNSEYKRLCLLLKEKNLKHFVERIEKIKKTEEEIKKDVSGEISVMVRGLVEQELEDITANLKKIVDFAQKNQVKHEDVEHLVENRLATLRADYGKFGKALGTLQRIVQQEHVNVSQSVHGKLDEETKSIKDEIGDLREDVELMKNLRGDLVDDVNRIIAGYVDKSRARKIENIGHAGEFEAERLDRLEETFNKKLAEIMRQMGSKQSPETEHAALAPAGEDISSKISVIERENQSLRAELEELKEAYFQIMKLQQNSPIIIE